MPLTKWTLGSGKAWSTDGPWSWNSVATPYQSYFQEYFQAVKLTDTVGIIVWIEPTATGDDGSLSHYYEWKGYTVKARTISLDASLALGPIVTLFTNFSSTDWDAPEGFTVERLDDTYSVVAWGMHDFLSGNTEGGLILLSLSGSALTVVDTEMMAPGFRMAWPSANIAKSPTNAEFYFHYNPSSGSSNTATYERVSYGPGGLTRNTSASISMLADGPVDGYWDVESLHVSSDGRVWAFQTGSMTLGGTLVTAYTEITLDGSRNPTGSSGTRTIIPALSGSWWTAQNAAKAVAPFATPDILYAFGSDVGLPVFQMGAGRIVYSAGAWSVNWFTAFEMPAWSGVTSTALQGYGSSTTFGIYQIYYASVSYPWSLTVSPNGTIAWAGPIHFPSGATPLSNARLNACWIITPTTDQGYALQDNVMDGLVHYQSLNDYGTGHPSIGGTYAADTATSGAYSNTAVIATDQGVVFLQSMDTWYSTDGSGARVLSLGYAHWVSQVHMRAHYNRAIMDRAGNLIPGCTVRVIDPTDGITNLSDTIYVAQFGEETRPNPYVCDDGILDFYLADEKRVRLGVTKPGSLIEVVFDGADVLAPPGPPPPLLTS